MLECDVYTPGPAVDLGITHLIGRVKHLDRSDTYNDPGKPPHKPRKQNICIAFVQCRTIVEDGGPTLYKCYKCFVFAGNTHTRWFIIQNQILRKVVIS